MYDAPTPNPAPLTVADLASTKAQMEPAQTRGSQSVRQPLGILQSVCKQSVGVQVSQCEVDNAVAGVLSRRGARTQIECRAGQLVLCTCCCLGRILCSTDDSSCQHPEHMWLSDHMSKSVYATATIGWICILTCRSSVKLVRERFPA